MATSLRRPRRPLARMLKNFKNVIAGMFNENFNSTNGDGTDDDTGSTDGMVYLDGSKIREVT
jgi:hypothetical protein